MTQLFGTQELQGLSELPLTDQANYFVDEISMVSTSSRLPEALAAQLKYYKGNFPDYFPLVLYPEKKGQPYVYDNLNSEIDLEYKQYQTTVDLPGYDTGVKETLNQISLPGRDVAFFKNEVKSQNVTDEEIARIIEEANLAADSLSFAMPNYAKPSRQNFFQMFALETYRKLDRSDREPPTAQQLLDEVITPQYYMVRPPGNESVHVLYPRRFIVPHANLGTRDIEYTNKKIISDLEQDKNYGSMLQQMAVKFGTDEGNLGLFLNTDGNGFLDLFIYKKSAPEVASPIGVKIPFETYSEYAKIRTELAMLEDLDSLLVSSLNLFADKGTIARKLASEFDKKIKANYKPSGRRSLQAMVPRIGLFGWEEGYYEIEPDLSESILGIPQTTLERELVGIWKSWFTQNTRIGIIEFELLNEYISMLNANPNADPDEIHKQMVEERSIREESTFDFIKRKYRESTSGINEKVDIFKKNYELNQ